tara:strand:- start:10034 stop:10990 length:957 start_codon:yes stop_codon:yes gene_type:complete
MYTPYASTNLGSVGAPAVGNLAGLESVNIGAGQQPLTAGNVRSLGQGRTFSSTQAFTTPLDLSVSREMNMAQRMQAYNQNLQNILGPAGKRAQQVQQAIVNNPGRFGMGLAALPALGTAVNEVTAGRPVGAVGAVGGAGFGAALGLGTAALLPAPLRGVAKAVLPTVGALVGAPSGAQGAEYLKRKVTGEPTKGKEGELTSQLAAIRKIADQDLDIRARMQGQNLAATKDLTQFYMQAELQQLQAMNPTIQKMKNAELVRNQAMANTMAGNYAMLGTVATAGKLATGAQAEAGANLRTALTANPYAGSVMQAPNISFG